MDNSPGAGFKNHAERIRHVFRQSALQGLFVCRLPLLQELQVTDGGLYGWRHWMLAGLAVNEK